MALQQLRDCLYLKIVEIFSIYNNQKLYEAVLGLVTILSEEQKREYRNLMRSRTSEIIEHMVNPYFVPPLKYSSENEALFNYLTSYINRIPSGAIIFWKAFIFLDRAETIDENTGELKFYEPTALLEELSAIPDPTNDEIEHFKAILRAKTSWRLLRTFGSSTAVVDSSFSPTEFQYHLLIVRKAQGARVYRNISPSLIETRIESQESKVGEAKKSSRTIYKYLIGYNDIKVSPTDRVTIYPCHYIKFFNALAVLSHEVQIKFYRIVGNIPMIKFYARDTATLITALHPMLQVMSYEQLLQVPALLQLHLGHITPNLELSECFNRVRPGLLRRGLLASIGPLRRHYFDMAERRYAPDGPGYEEAREEFEELAATFQD